MSFKTRDLVTKLQSPRGRRFMACEGATCGDVSWLADFVNEAPGCTNQSNCDNTDPCNDTCEQTCVATCPTSCNQTNNQPACEGHSGGCAPTHPPCEQTNLQALPRLDDIHELRAALREALAQP